MEHVKHIKSILFNSAFKKIIKAIAVISLSLLVINCGGDDEDEPIDFLEGTGVTISGTAAVGAPIVNANVEIRTNNGQLIQTTTDADGKFTFEEVFDLGPYLARVEIAQNEYLYSIAHFEGNSDVTMNIHPYTDFVIRNWFESVNIDIDITIDQTTNLGLPALVEVVRIQVAIENMINIVLAGYNIAADFDFFRSSFDANSTGFDLFLDNSTVNIVNNLVTIIVIDIETNIEITILNGFDLGTDLTTDQSDNNDEVPPTVPEEVRATIASVSQTGGEILVTWMPASDNFAVAGYNLFRNGELLVTTAFPLFSDTNVEFGVSYVYTIVALDSNGNTSEESAPSQAIQLTQPDTTAPSSVTNLTAIESNGTVLLSWQQPNLSEVAGFRIIRDDNIDYARVTSTSYMDTNVETGNNYCYRIVSFDGAGNEAVASDETCITLEGDAAPSMVSFSSSSFSVDESSGIVTIPVLRTGSTADSISVEFTVIGDTADINEDFIATSGTLNWSENDTQAREITIQILSDIENENIETIQLNLVNPTNTSLGENDNALLSITNVEMTCIDLSPTLITTNTQLSQPCYNVNNSIDVSDNATLTIDPGVTLIFSQGADFRVQNDGLLLASGTEAERILFTGAIRSPGYWQGIDINSAAESTINFVTVEYGGDDSLANIDVRFDARANITNSIIRRSGNWGVRIAGSATITEFSNNMITANENAPVTIDVDKLTILQSSNSFVGNETSLNENRDYIHVTSGFVETNQNIQKLDVDYRMVGQYTIEALVEIEPGVQFVFEADAGLMIDGSGTLQAIGTQEQNIVFTALEPTPGYWEGIQFSFNNNNNILDYTTVEYGGIGNNSDANVGVFGSDGRLTLRNSTIRHSSQFGVYLHDRIDLTMENNIISENEVPVTVAFNDQWQLDSMTDYTGNNDDRIYLRADTIETPQTVIDLNVPYLVNSTNQITVDSVLTIDQGVELQFRSGGGFNIDRNGAFAVTGVSGNPAVFTGEIKEKGAWKGIQYTFTNSQLNTIDFGIFEFGGDLGGNTEGLIGYFGTDTFGSISNSIFRSSLTNGIWRDSTTTGDISVGNTFEDIDGENVFID